MATFVIGPEAVRILPLISEGNVLVFDSLRTFDLWRKRDAMEETAAGPIAADIESVLAELGCSLDELSGELRTFFQSLLSRTVPAPVKDLVPPGISESTLYRRWRASLPITPKEFLARLRLRHAHRLVTEAGFPMKEAAWRAGFASAWHLRKAMAITREMHPLRAQQSVRSPGVREARVRSAGALDR